MLRGFVFSGFRVAVTSRFSVNNRGFHCSQSSRSAIEKYDVFQSQQADICLAGYNDFGFQIQNCDVYYSLFILPHTSLLWNVPAIELLKPEHFAILEIIPPIDLLLIGCGKEIRPFSPELRTYFDKIDVEMIEVQSTESAVGTFNVLNQEGRNFATCLFPIDPSVMLETAPGSHVIRNSD